MEPFLADLINDPKVPKWIRYTLMTGVCMFILYLGAMCALESPMIWGRIFGVGLCLLTLVAAGYMFRRIHRN